ncbi:MAG TPA: hypothetical protein VKU19_19110 [Bryobacteraceae bacterium]|nr:hypothetical protein [Bryobacteraceae bacterium]
MPPAVAILWCSQALFQSLAAWRIWRGGLLTRFPILASWFGGSALFSAILLLERRVNPMGYPAIYSIACLFALLLETACVIEVFFALCGKFRNFARIGGALLGILWLIGAGSSAAVRLSWVPNGWTQTWQLLMVGTRYADVAMVVVLAGAWLILRIPSVPIPQSANRATLIILGHSLWGFVVSTITIIRRGQPYWWMVAFALVGGCLTAAAASFFLRTHRDEYVVPPAPSREEVLRLDREARLAFFEFRQQADDLTRELFGE